MLTKTTPSTPSNKTDTALLGSLVKTTLVDYPAHVSCALFLHGCNLRCPYCYNKDLVTGTFRDYEAVTFSKVAAHLEKRKTVLTGFVISGGEPTLSPHLDSLIQTAHDLGYRVKLDTNGTNPAVLSRLFSKPNLTPDFVALDIKTSPQKYGLLGFYKPFESEPPDTDKTGTQTEALLRESLNIIATLPNDCREVRTVLVPTLVAKDDICAIASLLPKDMAWRFAPFMPGSCLDESFNRIAPYSDDAQTELVEAAKSFIPDSVLR